jgi:hypothetical protein
MSVQINHETNTIETSDSSSLTINDFVASLAAGGTGATTAADARTNLGLAIGTDVQAYDANILTSSDIGSTVQAYDANILTSSSIGSTVQAYDANILTSSDIGSTVQGYDANILTSSDIGSTVQAYDADTAKLDVAQTFSAEQTFGELKETTYSLTGTDIDPANGSIQSKTLAANVTLTESLQAGQTVVLLLEAGATYTIQWPTITWVTSGGNSVPTLTAKDVLVFWKVGTTLYGAYVGSYV